eukprot:COSAG02_NODE_7775_length_2851_cov_4.294331_3_plen_208_part_00
MRASNIAVFRASVGVMVTDQVESMPKHSAWVTFSNVLTDYCVQGMVINGSNTVSLSSGSFQSHEKSLYVEGADGTIRIAASRFKSNGDHAVHINASSVVTIVGSGIKRVFPSIKNVPSLRIESSSGSEHYCNADDSCQSQTILINGCDMESSDDTVVDCAGRLLADNTGGAIMCANDTAMLSGNFLRSGRNDSLRIDDVVHQWGHSK